MRYKSPQVLVSYTVFPLFLVGILFYFGYHAINGERGLLSRERLLLDIAHLEQEQQNITDKRKNLQSRIYDLGGGSGIVDRDLLVEQVRKLGMINENEVELKESFIPSLSSKNDISSAL